MGLGPYIIVLIPPTRVLRFIALFAITVVRAVKRSLGSTVVEAIQEAWEVAGLS